MELMNDAIHAPYPSRLSHSDAPVWSAKWVQFKIESRDEMKQRDERWRERKSDDDEMKENIMAITITITKSSGKDHGIECEQLTSCAT